MLCCTELVQGKNIKISKCLQNLPAVRLIFGNYKELKDVLCCICDECFQIQKNVKLLIVQGHVHALYICNLQQTHKNISNVNIRLEWLRISHV